MSKLDEEIINKIIVKEEELEDEQKVQPKKKKY